MHREFFETPNGKCSVVPMHSGETIGKGLPLCYITRDLFNRFKLKQIGIHRYPP